MFSTGDVRDAETLFSANYVDHQGLRGETIMGVDGFRRVVSAARAPYKRLEVTVLATTIDADKISARLQWRGTTETDERPVEREPIEILRIADGRVVEHWGTRVS
jgi:ketosteroid isomerase-like protein